MSTWTAPPGSTPTGSSSNGCSQTPRGARSTWCCSGVWIGSRAKACSRRSTTSSAWPAYGVGYRSFTEQYLDSCGIFKDAVLSILATIAKQERIRLSERTIAGLEKARRAGRAGGRPRVVVDRDRMAQLDEEGWTTREIGEEMGISAASVSRLLKAHHRPHNPAAGL